MNPILQKRIEEAAIKASDVCEPCDYGDPFCASCHRPYMYDAAKKMGEIILNNQWISVEEALPKEEKKVLVAHQYGCQVAAIYKDGSHSYWGVAKESPIGASITHWMPIPQIEGGEKCVK